MLPPEARTVKDAHDAREALPRVIQAASGKPAMLAHVRDTLTTAFRSGGHVKIEVPVIESVIALLEATDPGADMATYNALLSDLGLLFVTRRDLPEGLQARKAALDSRWAMTRTLVKG